MSILLHTVEAGRTHCNTNGSGAEVQTQIMHTQKNNNMSPNSGNSGTNSGKKKQGKAQWEALGNRLGMFSQTMTKDQQVQYI